MREPEMQEWCHVMKPEEKKSYQLTEEIASAIDRFFFNHYCQSFRSGAFARANSSMYALSLLQQCRVLILFPCTKTNDEYVW